LIAAAFLLFYYKGIFGFLQTKQLAGLDLSGNYNFAWLMWTFLSKFSVGGWTNYWFAGMPAFTFYPPLFFVAVALLNYLSLGSLSLYASYKLLILLSLFCFPLSTYHASRRMKFDCKQSLFIAVWSLTFVFIYGVFSMYYQTLNFGLVAQMFALNILLIFIADLFSFYDLESHSILIGFVPGLLLAAVILSHVFVAAVAVTALFVFLLVKPSKRRLLYVISIAVFGFVLSSFWTVPALLNLQYTELFRSPPSDIANISPLMMFFVLFMFLDLKRKDESKFFMLAMFLLTLLVGSDIFKLSLLMPDVQLNRIFTYSFLFGSLCAGMGYYSLNNFLCKIVNTKLKVGKPNKKNFCWAVGYVMLIALVLFMLAKPANKQWEGNVNTTELMSWISANAGDGRILTESDLSLGRSVQILESIPIATGKPVINELHVDSSVTSPYTIALQHEISSMPKPNPVCRLCQNLSSDPELILKQMSRFNVNYVITYGNENKTTLDKFLNFMTTVDDFYVYEVPGRRSYYEVPDYKPIMIVSSYKQWKQFNDKVFMDKELMGLVFAWSDNVPVQDSKFGFVFKIGSDESVGNFYNRIKSNGNKLFIKNIKTNVTDFNFSDQEISFVTDNGTWVLLKFSYFPKWHSDDRIYLANPSLMFVWSDGETRFVYES
jgi:hypothetical protein